MTGPSEPQPPAEQPRQPERRTSIDQRPPRDDGTAGKGTQHDRN